MKKAIVIILIIIVLIALIIYLVNPSFINKIWLWLIGLVGVIAAGIKKLGNIFGGKSIDDVKTENDAIKKDLENVRASIADTENRLKQERDLHQRELKILQTKLEIAEKQIQAEKAYREKLQSMTPQEYKESLSSAERERIENEIWSDVKFD